MAARIGFIGGVAIAVLGCGGATEPPRVSSAMPAPATPRAVPAPPPISTVTTQAPPEPPPAPAPPPPPPPPAVSSTQMVTWVWDKPSFGSAQLGFFRAGARVPRAEAPYAGKDAQPCPGKWYQVEPLGFVCDGMYGVTLNLEDPRVVAGARTLPKVAPLPYGHGMSLGTQMYARVPTADEQKQLEGDVAAWRKQVAETRAKTEPAKLWPELAIPLDAMPDFLENHAQAPAILPWLAANKTARGSWANYGVRLAFAASFESDGRAFYLTTEHLVVPADRVRAASLSKFHGVELAAPGERGEHLPMVWVRNSSTPAFVYKLEGEELTKTEVQVPLQDHAEIADAEITVKGVKYYELLAPPAGATGAPGVKLVVKSGEATRLDAAKAVPTGVQPDEVWVDVSISRQTLVIYRGTTPTFATLVSTGLGTKNHVTPWGNFRVYQKHVTSRMSAEEKPAEKEGDEAEHAYRYDDVPYVQYIVGGIALHAAFWHERFGLPTSHGCVNLAPRDAQYVFGKTLPAMPEGWHGINPGKGSLPLGTMVAIHG